jgi:hypothetical protein
VFLRRSYWGQGGPGITGGEKLPRWTSSPAAGLGFNSGAGRARVEASELGKVPGTQAELLRGLAGAEVQRCGDCLAAQRLYAVEQGTDGGSRASVAAVGFRVRAQGARGGLKGEAEDLGGAQGAAGENRGRALRGR